MQKEDTDYSALNTSTENLLSESSQNEDYGHEVSNAISPLKYFITLPHIVRRVLKDENGKLDTSAWAFYNYLMEISGCKSTSWKSLNVMIEELGLSKDTIRKAKDSLQKPSPIIGNKSLITIKKRYKSGTKERMSDFIILNDIIDENTMVMRDEFKNKSNVYEKTDGGCTKKPTTVYEKTARNNKQENNKQRTGGEPPKPQESPPPKPHFPSAVAASLFEELKKSGFTDEQISVGMEYYELKKDYITQNIDKPIAYVIKAIQDGYASDKVNEKLEEKKKESDGERMVEKNAALAAEVHEELTRAHPEENLYMIKLYDNRLDLRIGKGNDIAAFCDKDFEDKITAFKRMSYKLLENYTP